MSNDLYVLIHSPLVGPLPWKLVAEEMQQRGIAVVVPALEDSVDAKEPFWKQHAESVPRALKGTPPARPVILVAHSGAGPLLPAIRESIPNSVHAYVFVDAGLPRDQATRLDLMQAERADWAQQFQQYLEGGGLFPNWSNEDLQEILPDDRLRAQMVAQIRARGLDFFTEPIPVFEDWPDAPCIYILFSEPYKRAAIQTREWGWPTFEIEAGHFHMLVDAKSVTDMLVNAVNSLESEKAVKRDG